MTTHLPTAQKRKLEAQLRQRQEALHDDIQRELARDPGYSVIAGESPDGGDAATATLVTELTHAEIGRDLGELREIGAALRRMLADSYGVCADCGVDIPYERLQVQPAARRCTRCQTNYERMYQGRGRGPSF